MGYNGKNQSVSGHKSRQVSEKSSELQERAWYERIGELGWWEMKAKIAHLKRRENALGQSVVRAVSAPAPPREHLTGWLD